VFKKGDRVIHPDYGKGTIIRIDPKFIVIQVNGSKKQISHKGTIDVAFDSELGEDDGAGGQKYLTFLSDGRQNIVGSGYFIKNIFHPFWDKIEITKLEESE